MSESEPVLVDKTGTAEEGFVKRRKGVVEGGLVVIVAMRRWVIHSTHIDDHVHRLQHCLISRARHLYTVPRMQLIFVLESARSAVICSMAMANASSAWNFPSWVPMFLATALICTKCRL